MTDSNGGYHVIGEGAALTLTNRGNNRPTERARDLPGIVIFIHGVNDPGAVYSFVEEGLCQGLNERLDRNDLKTGNYGAEYHRVKAKPKAEKQDKDILSDPDTYLYQRKETAGATKSVFIPFYWGYRARNDEIARFDSSGKSNTTEVQGGVDDGQGFQTIRGQYQDLHGNRLDKHFGKAGGFFANATNNIPDMYGIGFRADWKTRRVTKNALGGNSTYAADAPDRRYFILAATRLAHLINLARSVKPSALADANGMQPEHETITIMGHSQGTILALLAQAILKKNKQRCVDCIIMVDSPYSLYETSDCNQTGHAKLQTLINIVNAVTEQPYKIPDLAQMLIDHDKHGGRAGVNWSEKQGKRLDKSGKNWVTFDERDNRGKVYLYFCPEDTVVGLSSVRGIGTFGVPDEVPADGEAKTAKNKTMGAMNVLEHKRFFQRMWTRMERDKNFDGNYKKVLVGTKPERVPVRDQFERLSPGPDAGAKNMLVNAALQTNFKRNDIRFINGEELKPPYEPNLYGGEVKGRTGGPRPGHVDQAGMMAPDDVTKNVILGNQYAGLHWKTVETTFNPFYDLDKAKNNFNAKSPSLDEQSHNWRIRKPLPSPSLVGAFGIVEREETPNEARDRMATKADAYEPNNYHSGILHSAENHRWVTAMDVAIGQAITLDDPVWRDLLIRIADWKMDPTAFVKITQNKAFTDRLSQQDRDFIIACRDYYQFGAFPGEEFVSMAMPKLVTSELTPEANQEKQRAAYQEREAEIRFYQNQAAQGMANLGNIR
ncbi:DUF3274 domain-containing protein [Herbaspirillum huttiense F1]|uniref:DUF3274 domain-containing protein n=1 Tax=Herbaspirillum huttiense subsp. lycopersici TaxID=3074428 RepID=A0ABU2ESK2_9BURK|nr:DUF3274 domain-containing protein [Herbaspirillum huttiense]MDR9850782.1 DUF3274 domain-containing protein [Herbaspirillum huttiense SE1]MDT0358943.1 DUF3274 domain-containing protein [Herbaspirillum huttiense F1]